MDGYVRLHCDEKTMLTEAMRTERLLLRFFRESDYEDLFEFLSQLENDEFEGYPGITRENGREHLKCRLGSEEFYAIELTETGKVIGNIYCGNRDYAAREVGYIVNIRYQRKGYAAEALSAVIAQAFRVGVFERVNEADEKEGKEARTLMRENTARHSGLKAAAGVCVLAAMLFLLTGCGAGSVFDGSRVSDASGFRMEYRILNQEESADLNLTQGDRLQVLLSHTEGTVDVTVRPEGKEPIYRGNGQQNADFVLEIPETGNYHISVSGHQAKGNITFARISGGQE